MNIKTNSFYFRNHFQDDRRIMKYKNEMKIPSKRKLILLSSLAITVLFTLPRIIVLLQLAQADFDTNFQLMDYALRTVYSFLFAVVFFIINLEQKKIRIGFIAINPDNLYHRIILNVFLFVLVDFMLIRFHLIFFEPLTSARIFRFVFNLFSISEVMLVVLISQVYNLVDNNYQMKISNESLLKKNAEARYEALKNQVNPHFLFNSFNTINSLIASDQSKAIDYVNNMSDVFRYVLETSQKDRATVEGEVKFIDVYMQMLKGRYGGKLHFSIDINPQYSAYLLPPMAVQVLVENAVKHNVISQNKHLEIHVYTESDNLVVSNNLQEKKVKEPSTGLGLYNLSQRCNYLSRKELEIRRTDNNFIVTIPLIQNENINY
jgi:two-component system, LytTR family, sensor kinase